MNLEKIFCPNLECPARGQTEQRNISVHSQKEERCFCNVCQTTFSVNKGTIFYRLQTDPKIVILVLTLLAHGCPVEAVVAAYKLDARTVRNWWERAGHQCEAIHQHIVGESQLDLQHVQADEIKVKTQGGSAWMAMATQVKSRLWLGAPSVPRAISP